MCVKPLNDGSTRRLLWVLRLLPGGLSSCSSWSELASPAAVGSSQPDSAAQLSPEGFVVQPEVLRQPSVVPLLRGLSLTAACASLLLSKGG